MVEQMRNWMDPHTTRALLWAAGVVVLTRILLVVMRRLRPAPLAPGVPGPEIPEPALFFRNLVDWFDLSQYPEGFVRGFLCTSVVVGSIIYFWIHKDWALPAELATMLAAAWGLVMSLDPRSSLKGWLVIIMIANVLAMLLLVPTANGVGWVNPSLGVLAVQGFTQYVSGRMMASSPSPTNTPPPQTTV